MTKNLVVVTSVINIPNLPFSYTETRSKFTREERFEQTKNTIATLKNKIPNLEILMVECSDLNEEETDYFKNNVNYFLNIYSSELKPETYVFGKSKSLGENTLLIYAINYLNDNNIEYDNFYKMSGRYWLNDKFNYENFNNDKIVYKTDKNNELDTYTSFYKIPKSHVFHYFNFINDNVKSLINCICAEIFVGYYLSTLNPEIKCKLEYVGVCGFIAVWDNYYLEY